MSEIMIYSRFVDFIDSKMAALPLTSISQNIFVWRLIILQFVKLMQAIIALCIFNA